MVIELTNPPKGITRLFAGLAFLPIYATIA